MSCIAKFVWDSPLNQFYTTVEDISVTYVMEKKKKK